MAYNKFKKLAQLNQQLGIKDVLRPWLAQQFSPAQVSNILLQSLKDAESEHLGTEESKI